MKFSLFFLILFGVLSAQSQVKEALVSGRYSSARQISSEKTVGDDITIKIKPAKKSKKSKATAPVVSELPTEKAFVDDAPNNPPKPVEKITAEDIKVAQSGAPALLSQKVEIKTETKSSVKTEVKTDPKIESAKTTPMPSVPQAAPAPVVSEEKPTFLQLPPVVIDSPSQLSTYQEEVHPDDVRKNNVEVDAAPFYFWLNSQSRYSFRNYKVNSLGLDLAVRTNLQNDFVVEGSYSGSFASDMSANDATLNNVPVKTENLDIGFKKINYFGLSRKAFSVGYGASFFDNTTKVSSNEDTRASLKTNGLILKLDLRMPQTPHYSHVINLIFAPKLNHKEMKTDLKLKSGTAKENYIIGLKWGGEIKLNRENQLIWSINYEVEKNLFSGTANTVDPKNGLKPENVSVTQGKTIFSFGYRWGE